MFMNVWAWTAGKHWASLSPLPHPPHALLHFPQADKETRHKCEHCDLIGASQFASLLNPRGALWHNDYSVNLRRVAGHLLPPAGSARGAVICYQHAPSNNLVISWHERQMRVCAQPFIYWWPLSFSERGQKSHDAHGARCEPEDCNCVLVNSAETRDLLEQAAAVQQAVANICPAFWGGGMRLLFRH